MIATPVQLDELKRFTDAFGFNPLAFSTISKRAHVPFMDVAAFWINLWRAWKEHPLYPEYSRMHGDGYPSDIYNPICVGIVEHEPGDEGKTESWLIAGLADNLSPATERFIKRGLGGALQEVVPLWPGCPVDPVQAASRKLLLEGRRGSQ